MGVSKATWIVYNTWLYSGIASFVFSATIVLTYIRFPRLRTVYFKLTLFLSLSDMLSEAVRIRVYIAHMLLTAVAGLVASHEVRH
jgi:hypothetical protein